jgi:hypothetical protein
MHMGCLFLPRAFATVLTLTLITSSANSESPPSDGRADKTLPPHPRLLLNAEGIAQLKQRIAAAPWAKASWSSIEADSAKALAGPVELPPRGGNWSHNYVCPEHGARLKQGRQLGPWQWEHRCPVGPHTLRGNPAKASHDFDGNAISAVHARLAKQIVDHGLVYQVTGDARHAARAREILLAYADRYTGYPLHDNQGKPGRGGRVASQSLTEAGWLTTFTQGADLVWTTLSEADQAAIADKVLRPALDDIILPRRLGIHNIQCHHNSAIGLVGFLLGDETLIARAIDDPVRGYHQQMEKGVLGDGMWTEGSSGYHFYTIAGLWPLTEAARNCGRNLYGRKLQSMFDGPLALAMPDFVLPDFNDSNTVALASQDDFYELALARFNNPGYAPLLAQSKRRGRLAMLYGLTTLPAGSRADLPGSRNSPDSGYAILQQGQGKDATWLCLKYGPHGGGHGHPDKNHFILYSRGRIVAPDAGTHAYGSPLHASWDKTTLAHNTLTVDETPQKPATGKCLAFGSERGVDYVMSDAGPVYQGLRFVRSVAMLSPDLVVFVDQVAADQPRTLDLVYHQNGTWEDLPDGKTWKNPPGPGYEHFTDATLHRLDGPGLTFRTRIAKDWPAAVTLAANGETEAVTGYGILKTTADRVPMLVQRRKARNTTFVWAVSLDAAAVKLRVEDLKDQPGNVLTEVARVDVGAGGRQWSLLVNPRRQSVTTKRADGTLWQTDAAFALP